MTRPGRHISIIHASIPRRLTSSRNNRQRLLKRSRYGSSNTERRMEARRLEPGDEAGRKARRRGWLLGSQEFSQKMLEQIDGKIGEHHLGKLRRETAEAKADRIVSEELGEPTGSNNTLRQQLKPKQLPPP